MITKENEIRPGDRITAMGHTFTVGSVLYQDYYGDRSDAHGTAWWGYDVEFKDDNGGYHHWKQNEDGGDVVRSVPDKEPEFIDYNCKSDKTYAIYRGRKNGKGIWFARETDIYCNAIGDMFPITYEQGIGRELIRPSSARKMARYLGEKLLPNK